MIGLWTRLRKSGSRFARDRKGVAAVEFALLGLPFFILMIALAEVTMIGFAQTSLDFAVSDAARSIRIGQVQKDGVTETELRATMCESIGWVLSGNCESKLFLDVQHFTSFVDVSNDNPIHDGAIDPSGFGFNPGNSSDIVLVRAYYQWDIITPIFQALFQNVSGGGRVLTSTLLFRNEPFPEIVQD